MRRAILSAQPARAVSRALGNAQSRRTFASPAVSPIDPSKTQAHPVGPFYEAVLRTPAGAVPKVKPEEPPVTSQESPKAKPVEKPKDEPKSSPDAAEKSKPDPDAPAKPSPSKPAQENPVPAPAPPKQAPPKPEEKPKTDDKSTKAAASPAEETEKPAPKKRGPKPKITNRARVVFGSSLSGPAERAERLARIRNESTLIAGVLVPPKPEEPDNCCMSGCVNCVWDRFRDDMEDWSAKTLEAKRRLAAREVGESVGDTQDSIEATSADTAKTTKAEEADDMSMDDDGGGSAANWDTGKKITKDLWDDDLYKNVPVGIREFMKQEKRLKEKHARDGTIGG
ncbi:oxidoreductase-like protein [Podospora australis]|uniref:Oxidoreductase-like protein n=1 Tax=Podospora australis TaxID=1536484 RepID=A0AAN6WTJ7_9PEZI|nr:oxidoreductase-like protein [Podospora australis]